MKSGFGDDRLRITSIKVFHGNSLSGRTCWLSEPYSDRPGYYGIPPARSQEDLDKAFQAMHDAGFQIATHSNGDREIDMVLTAIERAQARNPRPDARHRIEHASVMTQSLLDRAKKAGVILVFHSYMWEHGDKLESYGEKRLAHDSPVPHRHRHGNPRGRPFRFHGFRRRPAAAHSGHGDAQGRERQGLRRAISASRWKRRSRCGRSTAPTPRSKRQSKGSITPGKLADFAVLRKDPRQGAPDTIKDIVVDATYVGGERVWQATPNARGANHASARHLLRRRRRTGEPGT